MEKIKQILENQMLIMEALQLTTSYPHIKNEMQEAIVKTEKLCQSKSDNSLPYDVLISIGEACVFMQGYKGTCTKEGEWSAWDEMLLNKLTDILNRDN